MFYNFIKIGLEENKINSLLILLPSLQDLNIIIKNRLFNSKEVVLIKVILDIYYLYYKIVLKKHKHYCNKEMKISYYPTASLFKKILINSELYTIEEGKNSYIKLINKIKNNTFLMDVYNNIRNSSYKLDLLYLNTKKYKSVNLKNDGIEITDIIQ
jgi:hypothetical protein